MSVCLSVCLSIVYTQHGGTLMQDGTRVIINLMTEDFRRNQIIIMLFQREKTCPRNKKHCKNGTHVFHICSLNFFSAKENIDQTLWKVVWKVYQTSRQPETCNLKFYQSGFSHTHRNANIAIFVFTAWKQKNPVTKCYSQWE